MEGAVGPGDDAGQERLAMGGATWKGKEMASMARVLVVHQWRG